MDDKVYYSSMTGEKLKMGTDGLLKDSSGINYIETNGKAVPLVSPIHGGNLVKGQDGLYTSPVDKTKYKLYSDGTIKAIVDPITLGNLTPQSDGTYVSQATNNPFMYDEVKDAYVPLFIPDESEERGHIENGELVGNETGRRFAISDDGWILTPEEIKNRMERAEDLRRIQQMQEDGTLDEYTRQMLEKIRNQTPITREYLEKIMSEDLPDDIDELKRLKEDVSVKMEEQANQQAAQSGGAVNPYDEYKANMARHFEQKSDPNATLHSQYAIQYGEKPICYHQLQQINGQEVTILQQQAFPYDDEFRREMLEPSMVDYASRNPMANQQLVANPDFQGLSSYQTYSTTGNALSISNIDTQYANNIAATLPQIQPQQQVMQPQQAVQKPKSLVLTKPISGFASIALLSAIVGFISGLWLSYLSMLINVK